MPFKKGQSGNPEGRRAENRPLTDLIRRALLHNDAKKARKFADALVNRAIEQSDRAATEVLDRIEGKVPQAITGADGGPLHIIHESK